MYMLQLVYHQVTQCQVKVQVTSKKLHHRSTQNTINSNHRSTQNTINNEHNQVNNKHIFILVRIDPNHFQHILQSLAEIISLRPVSQ